MSAPVHIPSFLPWLARRDTPMAGAVAVALVFYSCSLVIFVTSGVLRGNYNPADIYRVGIPMMVVDGLIAFVLVWPLRWTAGMRRTPRLLILVAGVILAAALQSLWDTQLRIWAGTVARDYGDAYQAFVRAGTLNVYHTGLFVVLVAFEAANRRLRENHQLLVASRASERDAHMLALRFQLNPHFLFNTLNAISSLVVIGRASDAEAMLDRLSTFLRASLSADPASLVRVDEEFDMLDTYLEIEGVRFGHRLQTSIDLPDPLSGAKIPPFLLQPIVENAIKYAVAPSLRPVHVDIAAQQRDGELVLSVIDDGDGCGDVAPGTGVGLANVKERLRLNYGDAANLEKHHDATGCRVEITIPLDRAAVTPARQARAA